MSKQQRLLALAVLSLSVPLLAAEKTIDPDRIANTVVLKEIEVKNLGIDRIWDMNVRVAKFL